MGIVLSNRREVKVLIVGLDSAGKTAIQYRLKEGEFVPTIPSIGFNVETINYENLKLITWDLSAKEKVRLLWSNTYFEGTDILLFVVDSSDYDRISECKDELWRFLNDEKLKDAMVVVMANKQDLPNVMSPTEVAVKLDVHNCIKKQLHVIGTSARTGEGLLDGLSWIKEKLGK